MKRRMLPAVSLSLLSLLLVTSTADAASLRVDLQQELRDARIVTLARIVAYAPDGLRFQPPGHAAPMMARYSETDATWNPGQRVQELPSDDQTPWTAWTAWTALWPAVGEDVLVVVGTHGAVSLFAVQRGNTYRFWSPIETGSVAVFSCRAPAQPLPGSQIDSAIMGTDLAPASQDGCLMPVAAVVIRDLSQRESLP